MVSKSSALLVKHFRTDHYTAIFNPRSGFFARVEDDGQPEPFWAEHDPELLDISVTTLVESDLHTNEKPLSLIEYDSLVMDKEGNGYLHVHVRKKGNTYTDAEMYTRNLFNFGTFQSVLQGTNYYKMDPPLVLGLFTYGPNAGVGVDGENEIDIEFSNWDGEGVPNQVADFTVYPSTGNGTDGQIDHEVDFYASTPNTNTTTARFVWSSTSVEFYLMKGTVPVNQPVSQVFHRWTYDGTNIVHGVKTTDPAKWIPQQPCPVDINLWNFDGKPKHTWDIIVQEFDYLPAQ
jgi:hypothetical protein